MLRISKNQLQRLEAARSRSFLQRLETMTFKLRPDLRERVAADTFARFADTMTERAAEFGFTTEFEIAVFCATTMLQGNGWWAAPAHPLCEVVTRLDVEAHLRATQLLYELERLDAAGVARA